MHRERALKHWIVGAYTVCCLLLRNPDLTKALASHHHHRPSSWPVQLWDRRTPGPLMMSSDASDRRKGGRPSDMESLERSYRENKSDEDDLCEIVDEFGCVAYEEVWREEGKDGFRWIRIEREQSVELKRIYSVEDVLKKIEEVRNEQSKYGRADLYPRQWKSLNSGRMYEEAINGETLNIFSIAQFNALAEGLSAGPDVQTPFQIGAQDERPDKFERSRFGGFTSIPHPSVILDFSLRRWRILEVLLGANGDRPYDIIAIEEIDRFRGFIAPLMQLFGFEGVFMPKPRSPCLRMGWYSDGCALFWKKEIFELVSKFHVQYKVGNQVMILAVLRHRPTGKAIIVAVTHLKAQSSQVNEKIRCRQVEELQESVEELVRQVKKDESVEFVPTFIVGDFNADPPAHSTFEDSSISSLIRPRGGETDAFKSSYKIEPPPSNFFTTWKTRGRETVKRVIDYILYRGNVECMSTLDVPSEEELEATKLPGLRYPSDHMLIAAKFRID